MCDSKYGVAYTPETVPRAASVDLRNERFLDSLGVKYIRITWVDYINNIRYCVVPRKYFRKLLESNRPGVSMPSGVFGLVFLVLAPGFPAVGEYHYVIDASSFRLAPYAPGHASVMGFFQEKVPYPERGLVIPWCPRTMLKKIVDQARTEAGVSFLVGFENEFILLSATEPKIVPVNTADWSVSSKLPSGTVESRVLEEIAECLEAADIELQMYHAEAAPGQYEVVTGPLPPLEAADALVATRETIYNVASKHGLRATFAPRLYSNSCGSGAHTNISVHDIKKPSSNATTREDSRFAPTMTGSQRSFLQGVLTHIPALCALTLPTSHSYARVADGVWSGGTYASWGTDNREATVRLSGSVGQSRFEVRCVDGTASPYLALAGLLGAGTIGLIGGALLQFGDCPTPVAKMTEDEKKTFGVQNVGRVPQSIRQARENLIQDGALKEMLGETFVSLYLSVNETLERLLVDDTEEKTATKLVNFY